MSKRTSGILVTVIMFLYLFYTPLQSRFTLHIGELDFRFGILDISISLTNKLHIIGFGFLSIFLLHYLSNAASKYIKTFFLVMIFGLIIEITQIFFIDGHFRLRDLVSDAAGITISFMLYRLMLDRKVNINRRKMVWINLMIFILQIAIAMAIYFVFKEISVLIGGEQLRKFL